MPPTDQLKGPPSLLAIFFAQPNDLFGVLLKYGDYVSRGLSSQEIDRFHRHVVIVRESLGGGVSDGPFAAFDARKLGWRDAQLRCR